MKKKILFSIVTVIVAFFSLCFSSFAVAESFTDKIQLSYVNVRGLTVGTDYNRTITSGEDYEQSKAYAINQGEDSIQYFYCGFTIKTSSIVDDSAIPTANLGSANSPFYSGYYVYCRLRFKLYCDFRIGTTPNIEHMSLKVRDSASKGVWNWATLPTVGEISYSDFKQDSDGNWYTECEAIVSYKNEGETISDYSQQFQLCVKGAEAVPFYASVYTYTPYVYDFYYGDGSEPTAPVYKDFDSEYGGTVDNFHDSESAIIDGVEDGLNNFGDFLGEFDSNLTLFASPLLAISRGITYCLVNISWLNTAIYIALCLGLCAFLLNIVSSVAKRRKGD